MDFHALLEEPKFWIALSFVAFIVLFGKKLGGLLVRSLDDRAVKIANELETAEKLRVEAEEVLALYRRKYQESMQEAESILNKAKADAARMTMDAEAELKKSLDLRLSQANEKIAQAEKRALDEVKGHVVDITIAAARQLVTEQLGDLSDQEMLGRVISDLERKVH